MTTRTGTAGPSTGRFGDLLDRGQQGDLVATIPSVLHLGSKVALQSRTEQNTQEQVALPRKAGIAEQMKLGPSQGSCDLEHGVGYWGGGISHPVSMGY